MPLIGSLLLEAIPLRGNTFDSLLCALSGPLQSPSLRYCVGLDFASFLNSIAPVAHALEHLDSIATFSDTEEPDNTKWLASLPKLASVKLSVGCLAFDSLLHTGPKLSSIHLLSDIHDTLGVPQLGYCLALMTAPEQGVDISVWDASYSEMDRINLLVRNKVSTS